MADCTGLVQKILSHLKEEFHVQICPLKVGATGPHKLGNLSIWDEMSKDGKDHRRTARRNIWNIINPCKRECWYMRQMYPLPPTPTTTTPPDAFRLTQPLQTFFVILYSLLFLSLSFPMYLSLYLSFLSLLWFPWYFPKVFFGIIKSPLLQASKCIEGG